MAFRVRFDEGQKFRRKVERWKHGLRDLRWAWPQTAPAVARVHATMFNTQGPGWLPLTETTAEFRRTGYGYYARPSSEGPYHRILHWTHSLRDSLSNDTPRGTGLSLRLYGRRSMMWGTRHHAAAELHVRRPMLRPQESLHAVVGVLNQIIPGWMNRSKSGAPREF